MARKKIEKVKTEQECMLETAKKVKDQYETIKRCCEALESIHKNESHHRSFVDFTDCGWKVWNHQIRDLIDINKIYELMADLLEKRKAVAECELAKIKLNC